MKTALFILALLPSAICFCACSHTTAPTPTPDLQLLTKLQAANESIQGGDGLSKETAIILTGKTPAVIQQEYAVYNEIYGYGTPPAGQALLEDNGRHYDVLFDNAGRKVYFDITAYWKHMYGRN